MSSSPSEPCFSEKPQHQSARRRQEPFETLTEVGSKNWQRRFRRATKVIGAIAIIVLHVVLPLAGVPVPVL